MTTTMIKFTPCYYVTEEFVDKNTNDYGDNETNKKTYDNFEEAIVDFNKRIIGLEETEWDSQFWDIRLYRNTEYGMTLYIYYTTEDNQYIVYK